MSSATKYEQKREEELNIEFERNDESRSPGAVLPRVSVGKKMNFVPTKQCGSGPLIWKIVALMMTLCLITLVVLSAILVSRDSNCPATPATTVSPKISILTTSVPDVSTSLSTKLRIIERAEWGAQPPTEPLGVLDLPVPYVIISHTATDFCKTESECTSRVRFAQTFHIESRGWSDIGYNFLVGGDGYAYVGRGWDSVGSHAYNYNSKSIGISFIGTFNSVVPPIQQLLAAQELIELGVKTGKISPDYKLITNRQISNTLSPGDALYSVIQTWPNWQNISFIEL